MTREERERVADAIVACYAADKHDDWANSACGQHLRSIILKHLPGPPELEWRYCGNGRWSGGDEMKHWIEVHEKGHFVYGWRSMDTLGSRETLAEAKEACQQHHDGGR